MSPDWIIYALIGIGGVHFCWKHLTPGGKRYRLKRQAEKAEQASKAKQKEDAEQREQLAKDRAVKVHRDADVQKTHYCYKIGQHGNEALAIRYGIANMAVSYRPDGRSSKGPAEMIRLRKTSKIGSGKYLVALTDHRDRQAVAIIEPGTDYVKSFYPLDDSWFQMNRQLETTLKGNGSFSLKELATFHVERAVW